MTTDPCSLGSSSTLADVAVVIVTYNGAPWIRGCLQSLYSDQPHPSVIVVDNKSSDDTREIIESNFPEVVLLRNPVNSGFGVGNNIGIARAIEGGAKYIFLLNQDAYVLPDSVRSLKDFMEQHPEFGVASPLHCSPDPDHLDRRTLRGYIQNHVPSYIDDACMGRVQSHYKTYGVNAAAWFIRAQVLQDTGGFDPLFFMYGEDDDLLARWAHHGISFALLPGCSIVHLRQSVKAPQPTFIQSILRLSERSRSELLMQMKRPQFSVLHMFAVWLAYGAVSPVMSFLLTRRGRDLVASMLAALRVASEFARVVRHARLTATKGPHFLR